MSLLLDTPESTATVHWDEARVPVPLQCPTSHHDTKISSFLKMNSGNSTPVTHIWGMPIQWSPICLGRDRLPWQSSGPVFFVCFLPVSTPELSWDQLSWAQVYRFRFFCFCVSWARREQAHKITGDREQAGKVSHVTVSWVEQGWAV